MNKYNFLQKDNISYPKLIGLYVSLTINIELIHRTRVIQFKDE